MSRDQGPPLFHRVQDYLIRELGIKSIEHHWFIAKDIGVEDGILDLGANIGSFSAQVSSQFGCKCLAVEPEFLNFTMIPDSSKITKLNVAIGAETGTARLSISEQVDSHSLYPCNDKQEKTQITQVLSYHDLVSKSGLSSILLVKMDIEGAEWDVIDSMSDQDLSSIKQLTVEFHDFMPRHALRHSDTTRVISRLQHLGFDALVDHWYGTFNVLFVNRKSGLLDWRGRILIQLFYLSSRLRQVCNWIRGR